MFEVGQEPIRGYRLSGRLGQGACGVVWEATKPDGSVVALKFINCSQQSGILVANEIRTLVKLRELHHPSIIRLHDVVAISQNIALIMDRADGNLHELQEVYLQETGKAIPTDYLLDMLDQTAEALDFLAEQPRPGLGNNGHGMQHCDIKPTNLLILNDRLKVADFGLCMSSLATTHNRRFMGTAPYAAPELHDGRVSAHTDQYALAVTFAELVSLGRALLPRDLYLRPGTCPVELKRFRTAEATVLTRALDPDWTRRWPNCKSFLSALRGALHRSRGTTKKYNSRQQLQAIRRDV